MFVTVCKVPLSVYFIYLLIFAFSRERVFKLFVCVRLFMLFIMESFFIFFTKENCLGFSNLHVQYIKVK